MNQATAIDEAIQWSNDSSNKSMSYGELLEIQAYFEGLSTEFDLTEEFKENGII